MSSRILGKNGYGNHIVGSKSVFAISWEGTWGDRCKLRPEFVSAPKNHTNMTARSVEILSWHFCSSVEEALGAVKERHQKWFWVHTHSAGAQGGGGG